MKILRTSTGIPLSSPAASTSRTNCPGGKWRCVSVALGGRCAEEMQHGMTSQLQWPVVNLAFPVGVSVNQIEKISA